MEISFLLKEVITCGAVLSTFELVEALRKSGISAKIVSDFNNEELEDYFNIQIEREATGTTIAVSPKCEAEWAYVRTRDDRWLTHKSKKIAVSDFIRNWLEFHGQKVQAVIGNGTHERFYDMGLERDIDVLIVGNYEANKNIEETVNKAKQIGGRKIVWFGRSTQPMPEVQHLNSPYISEIPKIYNRAKVFISASKEEGWGRPVAEAMACGVPEVINENGGNKEIEVVSWESIAKSFTKQIC